MNTDQALTALGEQTSDAAQGILRVFAANGVLDGEVSVLQPGDNPFTELQWPAIVAGASYTNGVSGGNVFVTSVSGAHKLAAAVTGADPDDVAESADLDEAQYAALGDAVSQMMAAAAMVTAAALGDDVETGAPDVKRVATAEEASQVWEHEGHATRLSFSFCGEQCTLIQLVPNAFIMRLPRALDGQSQADDGSATLSTGLHGVEVRVWAELGRTKMASGRAVELPPGVVVELDRLVDDAVDVYVDGMRFATCRLLVLEDGALAMKLETIHGLQLERDAPPDPAADADADGAEVAA